MNKYKLCGLFLFGSVMMSAQAEPVVTPVKRPLVEEYTGLWCSFCPSGFVALEEMKEAYGDRFIAISYHNNDDMDLGRLPQIIDAYPKGNIDRVRLIDPGFFKIMYPTYLENSAPVEVTVDINWSAEERGVIKARTTLDVAENLPDVSYRLAHVLVADGLTYEGWLQSNAYVGRSEADYPGPWWELFIKGGSYVRNLVFNDIAVYSENLQGELAFLHATLKEGGQLTFDTTIPFDNVVNKKGQNIVENFGDVSKLRLISIVIDDTTNQVVNCNSSPYIGSIPVETGIGTIIDKDPIITEYYTIDGHKVSTPDRGFYIEMEKYSDGTTKSRKIFR